MAKILIIEDDEQMRAMLRQMLERANYQVVEAPDGNKGVSLFRKQPTDLIITDILMPEKEGLETIMEVKRDFPGAKIIAISGGGNNGNLNFLNIARAFGAQLTLEKPFSRSEMLHSIQQLIDQ